MRLVLVASLLAISVAGCTSSGSPPAPRSAAPPQPSTSAAAPARTHLVVRTALADWHAPGPVTRATVTPGPGGALLLAGGLRGGTSTSRVYALHPGTGRFRALGALPVPTHDAAALTFHGRTFVLGGGTSSTTDVVQETGRAGHAGLVVGHLPRPRSDADAVQSGRTGYLVGGYDGSQPDAEVLATRDGRSFRAVARLAVPVRYAAVVATPGRLLVIGGVPVAGPHAGAPVATIQSVDLRTGRTTVVGHLPRPVQGAVAFRLGTVVYLAGGRSASGSSSRASGAVFALVGRGDAVRRVGRLPVPVANAGIAVRGHRAWVVGGESSGRTFSTVQTVTQKVTTTP